mgnify:CR=1 FL=1
MSFRFTFGKVAAGAALVAGLMTATPSDASTDEMVAGDIATAKVFGERLKAVVSKFERMERRIDEMEARADLGQSDKALAQQFAELEADDQISRELEAMRQKLGQSDTASKGE